MNRTPWLLRRSGIFPLLLSLGWLWSCHWVVDIPDESPANQTDADGDGDGDEDIDTEPVPATEFCDTYVEALCHAHVACCQQTELNSIEDCIDEHRDDCDVYIQPIIDFQGTGYSPDVARDVINRMRVLGEDRCDYEQFIEFVSNPAAGLRFIEGSISEGLACYGLPLLWQPTYFTCALPLTCLHDPPIAENWIPTCREAGGLNDVCYHDMNCEPAYQCEQSGTSEFSIGTCQFKLEGGEACTRFSKCSSWVCIENEMGDGYCHQPTLNDVFCRRMFENQPANLNDRL